MALMSGRTMHMSTSRGVVTPAVHAFRPVSAPVSRQMHPTRVAAGPHDVWVMPPVGATFAPPTVSDTKARFLEQYTKPILSIYNNVLQELIVLHHFVKYNRNFEYNEILALGAVSIFDQVLEALPEESRTAIFSSYMGSLDESPEKYRADAVQLEGLAAQLSSPAELVPDANGTPLQQALAKVAARTAAGTFCYNKFMAIGLFRLLELSGAKDPSALTKLVKSVGISQDAVTRDLALYKAILAKLSAAKEMMAEFLVREKRKQAEREAEKAAKAAGKVMAPVAV